MELDSKLEAKMIIKSNNMPLTNNEIIKYLSYLTMAFKMDISEFL